MADINDGLTGVDPVVIEAFEHAATLPGSAPARHSLSMSTETIRCTWPGMNGNALYEAYHDAEWGMPERDSHALWEKLVLDGFQAGLSWITILKKREAFRAAFDDFDPVKVAAYGAADRMRLMTDAGIIRSNAKIDAAISGAKTFLDIQASGYTFSPWLWSFVGGRPIQTGHRHGDPATVSSAESIAMSKALKAKGFKFCGPVIVYAFMPATGMVNDHTDRCFRHAPIKAMGAV
jgi:DNA-3-methyladenine glycosylase I